ncbi:hypothetical protein HK104_004929 [Borealophlyctis nickersoniae]|nr:hypothetical protein HK104_004929 [Borealophlyctis nickersoniae]
MAAVQTIKHPVVSKLGQFLLFSGRSRRNPRTRRCQYYTHRLYQTAASVRSAVAAQLAPDVVDEPLLRQNLPSRPNIFIPSAEQKALFDEMLDGESKLLLVNAKAGTGKTTTLIQSLRKVPEKVNQHNDILDTSVTLIAYNRANRNILASRAAKHKHIHKLDDLKLESLTFHSLGFRVWREYLNARPDDVWVTNSKTWLILRSLLHANEKEDQLASYGAAVHELVSKAKMHGLAPRHAEVAAGLMPDENKSWEHLIRLYGICSPSMRDHKDELIEKARNCLEISIKWAGGLEKADTPLGKRVSMVKLELEDARAEMEHRAKRTAKDGKIDNDVQSHLDALADRQQLVMDFDDMIYLPIVCNIPLPKYDYVFVDEAQDMSEVRAEMVKRTLDAGSRVLLFGDHNQNIFQFSGCTSNWFRNLYEYAKPAATEYVKHESQETDPVTESLPQGMSSAEGDNFPAQRDEQEDASKVSPPLGTPDLEPSTIKVLPLTECRRCPKAVIELAQKIVKDITPAEGIEEGEYEVHDEILTEKDIDKFFPKPSVMIVARENRDLANMAFWLLSQGILCQVIGREIGRDMVETVDLAGLRDSDPASWLKDRFVRLREEVRWATIVEYGPPLTYGGESGLDDRIDSVMTLVKYQLPPSATIGELKELIKGLIKQRDGSLMDATEGRIREMEDPYAPVLLCTMHRARGLERDEVFILNENDFEARCSDGEYKPPTPDPNDPQWVTEQRKNLLYIAITRAKKKLWFVRWQTKDYPLFEYIGENQFSKVTGMREEERLKPWRKSSQPRRAEATRQTEAEGSKQKVEGEGAGS